MDVFHKFVEKIVLISYMIANCIMSVNKLQLLFFDSQVNEKIRGFISVFRNSGLFKRF